MAKMRLDKLLGHTGWGSRKEIKELCKSGIVTVNNVAIRDSSSKIDTIADSIKVGNESVSFSEHYYIMLHKPAGVLSATTDNHSQTVLDLLPRQYSGAGLFPVGRLDKDTTGLLLLTNDGSWAHRITSPKKHIDKVYEALVDGMIPSDIDDRFRRGIILDDGMECLPAKADIVGEQALEITVQEGKFHQVKRMCAALGLTVAALHRRSIGALVLDDELKPGEHRLLKEEEWDLPFSK